MSLRNNPSLFASTDSPCTLPSTIFVSYFFHWHGLILRSGVTNPNAHEKDVHFIREKRRGEKLVGKLHLPSHFLHHFLPQYANNYSSAQRRRGMAIIGDARDWGVVNNLFLMSNEASIQFNGVSVH